MPTHEELLLWILAKTDAMRQYIPDNNLCSVVQSSLEQDTDFSSNAPDHSLRQQGFAGLSRGGWWLAVTIVTAVWGHDHTWYWVFLLAKEGHWGQTVMFRALGGACWPVLSISFQVWLLPAWMIVSLIYESPGNTRRYFLWQNLEIGPGETGLTFSPWTVILKGT